MTMVSSRAAQLTASFERANDALIDAIEGCSEQQLRAECAGEGWPVVVTAHHVALAYPAIAGLVQAIATGQPLPPLTAQQLDAINAKHAEECADVSREETVAVLRREGAAAAEIVRGLDNAQLDRTAAIVLVGGETWSAADTIERVLIGHALDHGQSIRASLGR
jgi:uncharacterized damage-inducible protein DinB